MEHVGPRPERLLPGHGAGVGALWVPLAGVADTRLPAAQEHQAAHSLDCSQHCQAYDYCGTVCDLPG